MAHGEIAQRPQSAPAPWRPPTVGPVGDTDRPFDAKALGLLDGVIAEAEQMTGLRFSAYLGDLGADSRASATTLLQGMAEDAPYTVLVAMSPGQRIVEIVTGSEAARRITDRAARLAVLGVISAATEGDLSGALINGIRTLADQAGALPHRNAW